MKKTTFEVGDKIELTHIKSDMGLLLSENKYGSQLLDFDGIRTAKISMPIYENRVIPLEVGDEYQLCFFTNSGLFQCKGRVLKRYQEEKIHVLDVQLLTEPRKYQRRKFYRLECMFPIKYRCVSDVEQKLLEYIEYDRFESEEARQNCLNAIVELPKEWNEGTISDLSGGGMRFHGKAQMEKDSMIEVVIPLSFQSGIRPIKAIMKVIACVYFEGSRVAYEMRGEFQNITDSEREVVVKYVFEEQRRRMRKE